MGTDVPGAPTRVRAGYEGEVVAARRLTPHMVRIVLAGDGLAEFVDLPWSDHYVKVVVPGDDGDVMRSYTVRSWDPATRELALDFVVHGDAGRAGPWADAARVGDRLALRGQGGDYRPRADAAWHLLVGDESALPAIAVALEHLPDGAFAHAVVEVAGPDEEQSLPSLGDAHVTWIHRAPGAEAVYGAGLVRAVRDLGFPAGDPHVFLHGEAGMVRELRRHLRSDRGVPAGNMSVSGYWRLGRDDEAWRAEKAEWKAAVERDEAELGGAEPR